MKYALKVPYALSILAYSNPKAEVIGLDQFPIDEHPPLSIHYLFNIMVIIGMFMFAVSLLYLIAIWKRWSFVRSKWFRISMVAGGPLSIVAIETGWWLAEVGRQPWVLRGYKKER